MITTPYSVSNQQFSDAAHQLAAKEIYPQVFRCDASAITIESMYVHDGGIGAIYDGQMAIDKIISISVPDLKAPLCFTIQERWLRPGNESFQSLTITEWSNNSNLPSELYKIKAGMFVFGYYDETENKMRRCMVVDIYKLLLGITTKELKYTRCTNPRSNQTFVAFKFTDLHAAGVVIWDSVQQGIQSHFLA